jgi:hypothetical protein
MFGSKLIGAIDHMISEMTGGAIDSFLFIHGPELQIFFLSIFLGGMAGKARFIAVVLGSLFKRVMDVCPGMTVFQPLLIDDFMALVAF